MILQHTNAVIDAWPLRNPISMLHMSSNGFVARCTEGGGTDRARWVASPFPGLAVGGTWKRGVRSEY